MKIKTNKSLLIILGIVSVVSSRAVFALINDPEGPNLLIVLALALVIYFVLLIMIYVFQKFGLVKK
jgi:hypothetical protein